MCVSVFIEYKHIYELSLEEYTSPIIIISHLNIPLLTEMETL